MKNKLITALVALTLVLPVTAQAVEETKPATLAIIDTSLDTSLPIFKDKIVFEVCLLDWPTCPNGKTYQEGPGSVTMPAKFMLQEGFEHGTQMASTAVMTNHNLKIVFIRVVGATASGSRQIINESTFVNALTWVLFNKDRFNIQAVSMSQSHHNLGAPGTNYCPSTPLTENVINKLSTARISWPSCIASSISVSASAYGDGPAIYTNYDAKLTDFFARGDIKAFNPGGAQINTSGTSVSTQVAASVYLYLKSKYPAYTKDQVLSLLNTKSTPVVSRKTKGKILSIASVING
jgi:hypothetical protein